MLRPAYRFIRESLLHSLIRGSKSAPFANGKEGIEVVGLFHNATGLGESARLCAQQLQAEGFKVLCTSAEKLLFKKKEIEWNFNNTAQKDEIGLRIIHLNPPMIPPYAIGSGLKNFAAIYNIGYWAWELETLPHEWVKSLSYINAMMAPSQFICKTIQRYTDKPVIQIPHPVKIGAISNNLRERLGISEEDFLITSVFSVQSSIQRKNPEGLINAFLKSLADKSNAYLVFKVSPLDQDILLLMAATKNHPRIKFIEDIWPREDILGLIQTADIYASLHRSEGFGLGMAEAMMLGTPVVATGWSGNTDFCTEQNSFLVKYKMTSVQSNHPAFIRAGNSVWAEPDIDHAAQILKSIYEDGSIAKKKVDICLETTNQYFSLNPYSLCLEQLVSHPNSLSR
jgi:glycosyltransferase involved in cell wall biosynthesis